MPLAPLHLQRILQDHPDALHQLETLYAEMDTAYDAAAAGYGFNCRGCEDSCCRSRFYHHTLVEAAGLLRGYIELPGKQREEIAARARDYCCALQTSEQHNRPLDRLCPLNVDTRCLLYRQRPMICRLHGIPHTMRHPTRGLITGTGCHLCETSPHAIIRGHGAAGKIPAPGLGGRQPSPLDHCPDGSHLRGFAALSWQDHRCGQTVLGRKTIA